MLARVKLNLKSATQITSKKSRKRLEVLATTMGVTKKELWNTMQKGKFSGSISSECLSQMDPGGTVIEKMCECGTALASKFYAAIWTVIYSMM